MTPRRFRRAEPEPVPEPGPGQWKIEIAERRDGSVPYADFLDDLDDYRRTVLDLGVKSFLAKQGHNVCGTEWGKSLGKGLYEFRVRRTLATLCGLAGIELPATPHADTEVLLRVFFAVEGDRVVLLLGGYDKGADASSKRQDREIQRARAVLTEHKEMQKQARKDAARGRTRRR